MTHDQCLFAARQIERRYLSGFSPHRHEDGVHPGHLKWMVNEMHGMSQDKAMRWLGYIQGVLVAAHNVPLSEMKELSRNATMTTPTHRPEDKQ